MLMPAENAIDLLERQHKEIRRSFRLAFLPGPFRRKVFEKLMRQLDVHEAAEEAHIHPTARRVLRAGRRVAAERRREEKHAKKLLTELWRTGPEGKGYLRRLNAVRRLVLRHAAREEKEEFAALRKALSHRRLRMLGLEVRMSQLLAPTRPHPLVNNEVANKLASPVLGPLDRARDLARHARRR